MSEAIRALNVAQSYQWGTIISARSGETENVIIAHLAVGLNAGQMKVGSLSRSERTAKWNEILRIDEASAGKLSFAHPQLLPRCLRTVRP